MKILQKLITDANDNCDPVLGFQTTISSISHKQDTFAMLNKILKKQTASRYWTQIVIKSDQLFLSFATILRTSSCLF